jgi:predicted transposase/invertase (TIGR01784 family)
MERLNPLNDYIFLKVMGEEGSEAQCLAFLNAVLASKSLKPIKLVKILENKTFTPDIIGDKKCILDLRAEDEEKNRYNVEVQLKDFDNMERRSLFHWGREFTSGISEGENYKLLPRVITINIVDFDFIELKNFHTCFHLRETEERDYILTDVLEIHFINMVRFRKLKSKDLKGNSLLRWVTFLEKSTPEEVLKEVIAMDTAISMANDRLNFVSQDKEVLRLYHMREMAMSDWTTAMDTATDKGIAIGKSEGKIEVARSLLREGSTPEFVQKTTGLDIETIQSLRLNEI